MNHEHTTLCQLGPAKPVLLLQTQLETRWSNLTAEALADVIHAPGCSGASRYKDILYSNPRPLLMNIHTYD